METKSSNKIFKVSLNDLHPTQFCLGFAEVSDKVSKYSKLTPEQLDQFLILKAVPIVIGPGKTQYLIDRHHNCAALLKMNKLETYAYLKADLSHLDNSDFWKTMVVNSWTWMVDEKSKKIDDPSLLPVKISDMRNDPYRSLMYFLVDSKIIKKDHIEHIPFLEFYWAEQIKAHLGQFKDSEMEDALLKAKDLIINKTIVLEGVNYE